MLTWDAEGEAVRYVRVAARAALNRTRGARSAAREAAASCCALI